MRRDIIANVEREVAKALQFMNTSSEKEQANSEDV
jgi:hypothetical protein